MSIIEKIVALLAPHDCLGCGTEGSLLCSVCLASLPATEVPLPANSRIERVQAVTLYEGLAKDLIWKLKSDGAQAAADIMAESMTKLLEDKTDTYIIPIPTATSRVRQRGYDQAKLIAKVLSYKSRLPYLDCLARHGQAHQVGAHRTERLSQLDRSFRVKKQVSGKNILLVDDVTTTGATLETATTILKQAGANRIEAVTFAYAESKIAIQNNPSFRKYEK